MKKPECKEIVSIMLPAVRASVAEEMHYKYGCNQKKIAQKLGVVQVAVSKYLNSKYSKEILRVKNFILESRLSDEIVGEAMRSGVNRQRVDEAVDRLCEKLVEMQVTA